MAMLGDAIAPRREKNLSTRYKQEGELTTVMFRNVPATYTQEMLLEEMTDVMGDDDSFDFFYLPWDLTHDRNVGYAFVNFRTSEEAERSRRVFSNYSFRRPIHRERPCKVCYAHVQGLLNNVRHLMDRAVSEAHSHYPLIIWEGKKLKLGKVISVLDRQRRLMRTPMVENGLVGAGAVAMVHLRQAIAMTTPEDDEPSGVPGQRDVDVENNNGELTTLMLRNIPPNCSQEELLEVVVECMGSIECFDFFYLPWDLVHDRNVGYAFVNFRDGMLAERCIHIFNNYVFRSRFGDRSERPCKVGYARIQGLINNIKHLMDRAVSDAHEHYPVIISEGRQVKLGDFVAALEGEKHCQLMRSALQNSEVRSEEQDQDIYAISNHNARPLMHSQRPPVHAPESTGVPHPVGLLWKKPNQKIEAPSCFQDDLGAGYYDGLGSNSTMSARPSSSGDGMGSNSSLSAIPGYSSYGSSVPRDGMGSNSSTIFHEGCGEHGGYLDEGTQESVAEKSNTCNEYTDAADDDFFDADILEVTDVAEVSNENNGAEVPVELLELCNVTEHLWVTSDTDIGGPAQLVGRLRL